MRASLSPTLTSTARRPATRWGHGRHTPQCLHLGTPASLLVESAPVVSPCRQPSQDHSHQQLHPQRRERVPLKVAACRMCCRAIAHPTRRSAPFGIRLLIADLDPPARVQPTAPRGMGCRARILARGMWVDSNRLLDDLHSAASSAVAKVCEQGPTTFSCLRALQREQTGILS